MLTLAPVHADTRSLFLQVQELAASANPSLLLIFLFCIKGKKEKEKQKETFKPFRHYCFMFIVCIELIATGDKEFKIKERERERYTKSYVSQ